jgi:hypothetical protein
VVCSENKERCRQSKEIYAREREFRHSIGSEEEIKEDTYDDEWEEEGNQSVNAKCEVWRYCQTIRGGPCPFLLAIPDGCGMGWTPDGDFRL